MPMSGSSGSRRPSLPPPPTSSPSTSCLIGRTTRCAEEDAVAHVREVRDKLKAAFPGKEILIGEVGWPSQGRMREGALPSPVNQARFLSGVVEAAKAGAWKVNLIEAFDQPWKRALEGTVGGYWGVYDDARLEPKFHFGEPVSNHPDWRLKAALGIGAALLAFVAFWLGPRAASPRRTSWRRELAAPASRSAPGSSSAWPRSICRLRARSSADRLRGVAMLVLALVVPMAAAFAVGRGERLAGFAARSTRLIGARPIAWRWCWRRFLLPPSSPPFMWRSVSCSIRATRTFPSPRCWARSPPLPSLPSSITGRRLGQAAPRSRSRRRADRLGRVRHAQ